MFPMGLPGLLLAGRNTDVGEVADVVSGRAVTTLFTVESLNNCGPVSTDPSVLMVAAVSRARVAAVLPKDEFTAEVTDESNGARYLMA